MFRELFHKGIYIITSGNIRNDAQPGSAELESVLKQVRAAVKAGIQLIQIREKNINVRSLGFLAEEAANITRGSATRLLVNDRSDVASVSGAHGVHLTTESLEPATVRRFFGSLLIGSSTHSVAQARIAQQSGADFVVFGPIFPTQSKKGYRNLPGLPELRKLKLSMPEFPVFGLGGVTRQNFRLVLEAGANGIAGISLFNDPSQIEEVAAEVDSFAFSNR